ncbi:unnamed protein product [Cyprideis torosa]|uniref:rRNA adenine N(6)-methyltransferase n=1 Tax=Cyprideis torosa TaxID=163714 RepID=A0A7R8W2D1_9CRUS|nr:unnamed protein product [Cyprideis torosa]CAG0881825.1 unnamed protein product [Cyprideis torosa]
MTSSKVVSRFPTLPSTRDLLRIFGLRARKSLSQNFLLDPRIIRDFVAASGYVKPGTHVIEVGPGPGGITREILRTDVKSLIVIEKDRRFIPTLSLLADAVDGQMKIIRGDILTVNVSELFPTELRREWDDLPPPISIVGNLPFSVSTHLIIQWYNDMTKRRNAWAYGRVPLTLTFQKEVVDRMLAHPGDSHRSRLSVMSQVYCHVTKRFNIKGGSFVPPPEVDATVACFLPRVNPLFPPEIPFEAVERFVRVLFQHKKSRVRNAVARLVPVALQDNIVKSIIIRSGVTGQSKVLDLENEEICKLLTAYMEVAEDLPGLLEYDNRSPRVSRMAGFEMKEDADRLFPLRRNAQDSESVTTADLHQLRKQRGRVTT